MQPPHASLAGELQIGGAKVNRIGFGAMRITGPEVWGPPADMPEVMRTLRSLPELGISFIDTSSSCGRDVSESLSPGALFPYEDLVVGGSSIRGAPPMRPSRWRSLAGRSFF